MLCFLSRPRLSFFFLSSRCLMQTNKLEGLGNTHQNKQSTTPKMYILIDQQIVLIRNLPRAADFRKEQPPLEMIEQDYFSTPIGFSLAYSLIFQTIDYSKLSRMSGNRQLYCPGLPTGQYRWCICVYIANISCHTWIIETGKAEQPIFHLGKMCSSLRLIPMAAGTYLADLAPDWAY